MSFDFCEDFDRQPRALTVLLQDSEILLQLFVGAVHGGNQISHVSNCIGIEADSENHPPD